MLSRLVYFNINSDQIILGIPVVFVEFVAFKVEKGVCEGTLHLCGWECSGHDLYLLTSKGLMLKLKLQCLATWYEELTHLKRPFDAGKDWRREEKGTTEDEMIGWHHQLNRHWFGWTLGTGDGQGGLACCGSWGHKESDTTAWLNWTELNWGKEEGVEKESNFPIKQTEKFGWRLKGV